MSSVDPKRVKATEISYAKRFRQLWLRAREELQNPKLQVIAFVEWLLAQQDRLKPRSFRQYRAATMFALQFEAKRLAHRPPPGLPEALRLLKESRGKIVAVARTDETGVGGREKPQLPLRTSAAKARALTDEASESILDRAQAARSRYAPDFSAFFKVNLLCGLRPIEWHGTQIRIEGGALVMIVPNAKRGNGRAHGPKRTLVFDDLSQDHRDDLVNWANRVNALTREVYQSLLKRIEEVMRAITKRLFRKNRPTPYTTRHAFSGRLKAFYLGNARTEEEYELGCAIIAALMGHATDDTADFHYGKKSEKSGKGLPIPRADPAEVARIRPRLVRSRDRLRALEARRFGAGPG
ncbi:MAG: hypothetical protein DI537_06205 [Stutzerimonas stutzeri]|nr:MAG: hypothetical protein DI537_06205 [Stutzerimonas stutzeri]